MKPELLKGHLDLLVLSVLVSKPLHGYALITALRNRSAGEFDLPEGTVYPALHRLEQAGCVSSEWSEHEGRRRRVYSVTALGRSALEEMSTEYARFSAGVRAVLLGAES